MRFSQAPTTLLSLLLTVLSHTSPANAGPYPKDNLHDLGYSYLQDRSCAQLCGSENQYCCEAGTTCTTNQANIATCVAGATVVGVGGGYALYTVTYTETGLILRTSTFSSWYQPASTAVWVAPAPVPTTNDVPAICPTELGWSSCGKICCASDQRCAVANSCTAYQSVWVPSSTYSAPVRPTSGRVSTATSFVSATTTMGFLPAATASGTTFPTVVADSSNGLSAGAIAGIVIGVIAGIILLILLCFCCIVKAGFSGLAAIFGLGKKKRRSTERIETVEHYSRHGSGTASRRETHGGWFGGGRRPARVDESRKKKSSGLGGIGAVGAGLLGLAAVLGLKRQHDKEKPARSDISSSYYTDSYTGTSASSASSDRRTRDSRRPR